METPGFPHGYRRPREPKHDPVAVAEEASPREGALLLGDRHRLRLSEPGQLIECLGVPHQLHQVVARIVDIGIDTRIEERPPNTGGVVDVVRDLADPYGKSVRADM